MSLKQEERSYHDTASPYALPNDNPEHERLEAQGRALNAAMRGRIFHAPVRDPKTIIEIGAGTGTVTCQLGLEYPGSQIYGVDLSPVPPNHPNPENVMYIQGDFHDLVGWDQRLGLGTVDFVFQRMHILAITDWQKHIQTTFNLLRSGGYFELQESEVRWYDASGNDISKDWDWWKAYNIGF